MHQMRLARSVAIAPGSECWNVSRIGTEAAFGKSGFRIFEQYEISEAAGHPLDLL